MDFKEYVLRLAAEQGCDLEWRAVVEAAGDDPEEVVEALDRAALVAARQLVQVVLAEAAADLRGRLEPELPSGTDRASGRVSRRCSRPGWGLSR